MRLKVCLGMALLFVSALAFTQEGKPPSAEEAAMMKAMRDAATPGTPHQRLNDFVGRWTVKATMWPAPNAPGMVSEGIATSAWVLGDRYVEQRFSGSMMGMPFEGIGYTGYDNVKKQYWGVWMDSMSTGVMTSTGKSADGKSWTFTGSMVDPMSGKEIATEERITVSGPGRHTMEMWVPGPDGKKFKSFQLEFTRMATEF